MRARWVVALAASIALAGTPEFEVASIKRNLSGSRPWLVPPVGDRFTATNVTLKMLISMGWDAQGYAISGGPSWVGTEGYDVSAREPQPDMSNGDLDLMMRNLLQDRFGLKVHYETREAPVYALVPAKSGLNLPGATPKSCLTWKINGSPGDLRADPRAGCGDMDARPGFIADEKVTMAWFAGVLEAQLHRPVLDRTGFTGSFKLRLEFAPVIPDGDSDGAKPSIFAALQEQLGLRLESTKGPVKVLVVDHAEKPGEN